MQKSMSEQQMFMKNSNIIPLSPKKQSTCLNSHFMSTKYCLNKPKLFNQFKKSSLFQQSKSNINLHQYSQRFTYNQKINSFEKQNLDESIKNFNPDQSMDFDPQKRTLHKVSKNQIMKKIPQLNKQNFQSLLSQKSRYFNFKNHEETQDFSINSSKNSKFISSKNSLTRLRKQKRHNVYNREFTEQFPHKDEKQVLLSYIHRNPLHFSPIKFEENRENLRKMNQSCRKLDQTKNIGSKWNLSTQRLKSTRYLSDQDKKYERQRNRLRQQLFVVIDDEIKKMYDLISQLKSLGYAQEKVSQWMWIFCENSKKFLQQIIFKPQVNRNSLSDCKLSHKIEDIQQTKANARKFKRIINNLSIDIQVEDLCQLTNYLEEILISKQQFELKRIQNQIEDTKYAIRNNYLDMKDEKVDHILKNINKFQENKKFTPLQYFEMLNFYQDAKRIESNFGKVKGLTTSNRKKFENLTDIEIQLQKKKVQVQN